MSAPKIYEQTQLAEASYSNFIVLGGVPIEGVPTEGEVESALIADDFSPAQAKYLITRYRVLHYRPNTSSGFAAAVVENLDATNPGLTFVIRGTELPTLANPDVADLDAGIRGIATNGAAFDQIVDLYNYWQQLTSPAGEAVRLARIGTTQDPNASGVFFPTVQAPGFTYSRIEFFNSAANGTDSGLGIVSLPVSLSVTGHSLGGHLAIAFERLFSLTVTSVSTVNAAGFRQSDTVNRFFNALAGPLRRPPGSPGPAGRPPYELRHTAAAAAFDGVEGAAIKKDHGDGSAADSWGPVGPPSSQTIGERRWIAQLRQRCLHRTCIGL